LLPAPAPLPPVPRSRFEPCGQRSQSSPTLAALQAPTGDAEHGDKLFQAQLPTLSFTQRLASKVCNTKQRTTPSSFSGSWERVPSPFPPTRSQRRFPGAVTGLSDQADAVARGQGWERPCQRKVPGVFWLMLMPTQPRRCQSNLADAHPASPEPSPPGESRCRGSLASAKPSRESFKG